LVNDLPLLVCVSADVDVRERVVRGLKDCGAVLICANLDELRAMLFPHLRRPEPPPARPVERGAEVADRVVSIGDLVVDLTGHLVTWRGEPLPLTRLERALLARLATPPMAVWTYQRLFDAVWGKAYLGDTSILHSAVKRLRGKLRTVGGGLGVETVRGVGYRLRTD